MEATRSAGALAQRHRVRRLAHRRRLFPQGGRGVSFIGADGPNDVSPSGLPQGVGLHQLALVAMGVSIFDNLDFERAVEEARRVNRYEFLFMAAPLRVEKGAGSPLNPGRFLIATRPMPVVFVVAADVAPRICRALSTSTRQLGFELVGFSAADGWASLRRDVIELMVASPNAHRPFDAPAFTGSNSST